MLLIFIVLAMGMQIGMAIFVLNTVGEDVKMFVLAPIIFLSVALIIPISIIVIPFIQGRKFTSLKKTGREGTCEVFNILSTRTGYQLIVSYKGESGKEYKQSIYLTTPDAGLLKPGLTIGCYLKGEVCYVDPKNIVIKEKDRFEY